MVAQEWVRRLVWAAIVVSALTWSGTTAALTDEEIFRGFRFDVTSPGARALGMGGAFVAVANDATATQANPAGLHFVDGPQVFVEFRRSAPDTQVERSNLGSLEVDGLTGDRDLPFLSLSSVSEAETISDLGFIGVVWPTGPGWRHLSVAASRHVLLSDERTLGPDGTQARFAFDSFPNTVNGSGDVEAYSVVAPVTGSSEVEIVSWDLAASIEAHPDFSVGVSVSMVELDFRADTLTTIEDPAALFVDPGHPRLPATPTTDLYRTSVDDTDSDVGFSVGLHWHPDSAFATGASPWRFGAVFRQGTSFEVRETTALNDVADRAFDTTIVVPDRYSVGATFRPRPAWTLALEVERVEYSDMLDGFDAGVNYLTSGRVAGDAFGVDPAIPVTYDVDDGTIPRIGAEYARTLGAAGRLSVQAGYFRSPDSRIRMTSFNSDDDAVNRVYLDAFRGAEAQDHFTLGVGYGVGSSTIRAAGEFSDLGSRVVANYVFQSGGR